MKIAKWITQTDGNLAWVSGDHELACVYAADDVWRTKWFGEPRSGGGFTMLSDDFPSAHDACLAAEKCWPPPDEYFGGWLESKNGGLFRKFTNRRAVYVRKADDGWYAVRTDGKLLGRGSDMSWFATAVDACRAVEKELYAPVDADPFADTRDQWRWMKFAKSKSAQ